MNPSASAATNIVGGTATRYMLLAVNIGLGIFLMPFTVNHLGKGQYGLWMLVASITYYFALLDLGYDSGVVRHIVEADARGDVEQVNRIVSTFVCVYAVIGLIALAAIGAVIAIGIPRFPKLTPPDIRTARVVIAILGVRIAIGFPMTIFGALATSRQAFVRNNYVDIVLAFVMAGVTYVVLSAGGGLIGLVFATTSVSVVGYIAYARTARSVFPELQIRVGYFSRALWKDVTTLSLYLFVIDIAVQVTFNIDNLLIGAFLGTSTVAVYAVAVRLAEYQRRLCDQFSGMMFPIAVGIGAAKDQTGLRSALIEGARVGVILVVGVTVCLVAFGEPLIQSWMGPGFRGSVVPLYFLSVVGVVLVANASQTSILLATGSHRLVAWVWIAEAIANLLISLALVRRFGAAGVAAGTAIPIAVGHFGIITPTACRRTGITLFQLSRATIVPAVIGAVPAILLCRLIQISYPAHRATEVILQGAAVGVLYLIVVIALGLDDETRRRYWRQLAALRTIVSRRAYA